jgi:hypothetical protein
MKTELLFVAMPIRPSWGVGYIGVGQALLGKEVISYLCTP